MSRTPRRLVLAALSVTLSWSVIGIAAPNVASAATTYPVTIKAANGSITVESRPTAIVSMSPTATEMLYAIGAGGQVKAVDSYSDYPKGAPKTTARRQSAQRRGHRRLQARPGGGLQ